MRKRQRERAPQWVSFAAPAWLWGPAFMVGFALGAAADEWWAAPFWAAPAAAGLLSGLTDVWWRRTRPPSDDASWSLLARLFYRRKQS